VYFWHYVKTVPFPSDIDPENSAKTSAKNKVPQLDSVIELWHYLFIMW